MVQKLTLIIIIHSNNCILFPGNDMIARKGNVDEVEA